MNNDTLFKKIVYNLLKTFSSIVFPVITFSYASRILGTNGVGRAQFSRSFIQFFSMLAVLGMNYYGTREGAKIRENKQKLSKFTHEMLFINGITTILSYLLLIMSIVLTPQLADYRVLLYICSIAILLQGMGMEWLYQAIEEYRYIAVRSVAFQVVSLGALFFFVKDENDVVPYTVILLISSYGSYIFNFWRARKIVDFHYIGKYEIKKHISPILWLFAMAFSIEMFTVFDSTMLGFLADDSAVGKYTAAIKVEKMVNSLIFSLSIVLIPRLSYYIGCGKKDRVAEIVNKAYNYIFMFSVPAAIGLFMLSDEIIRLFSGTSFATAGFTMRLLAPIVLLIPFNVSTNQQTLIPMGHEKRILISTSIGALVNFSLNLLLIPAYAENGAAVATVISELCVFAVTLYNANRFFDMKRAFKKYHQYWLASAPIPFIAIFIKQFKLPTIYSICFVITGSVILYFGILLLLKNEYLNQVMISRKLRSPQIKPDKKS